MAFGIAPSKLEATRFSITFSVKVMVEPNPTLTATLDQQFGDFLAVRWLSTEARPRLVLWSANGP